MRGVNAQGLSIGPGSVSISRLVAGFVCVICASLIGLQIASIVGERSKVLSDAKKDTANLTSSLVQHADLTFKTADSLLVGLVERLEHEDLSDQNVRQRLRNWFLQEVRLNSQFVSFAVIDRDGKMIVTSTGQTALSDYSDRDYFIHHRDHDDRELLVGKPVKGRNANTWLIPTTRRFNRANGTFGGVAVAALDPVYFQTLYDGLDLGRSGAVLLASTHGSLLARRPFVESNIGRDMTQSGIFKQLKLSPVGSLEIVSSTDGVRRLNSYQQALKYPLVVAVAQDVEELLAAWKEAAIKQFAVAVLVAALIAIMGAIVWNITRALASGAKRLQRTNVRFEAALANMTQGLCLFDGDKRLVISNSRFRDLYDLPEELVRPGTPLAGILDHQYRHGVGDYRSLAENIEEVPNLLEQSVSTGDGRTIHIKRTPIRGGGWVATHEDVTQQRRQERLIAEKAAELEMVNDRLDAALSNMIQGISMFDKEKRLVVWNARYVDIFRFPPNYLKAGMHVNAIAADLLARGVLKGEQSRSAIEQKIATMDGLAVDTSWVEELADGRSILISRQPMGNGGWLATSEDITERRRAEAEIVRLARHDPLTGLANRAEFGARLEEASKRTKRYGSAITVMMLDLDKFKHVNDTLGHPAGDMLLVEVAGRLRNSLRETDVLARLGGDEFAIIQEGGTTQHEGAIALALRIIQSITTPFDLNGHQASIGTSIGIAMAPEHGVEPSDLLKKADIALYAVKAAGRNDFRIFEPPMLEATNSRQTAEEELRSAIENEEFELLYQPVMDARTNDLCAAEALIRWKHPARGLIEPDQFIPLAEATGLIVPMGAWVLQQACADAASWPEHIRVAVNVSAVHFRKGNLFDVILCALAESGLAPDRLELEITETVLVENVEENLSNIRQLKNLGISVSIDDFGTGNSSMSHLTLFPFDKIKIDKSFTQAVLARRDFQAVVASTLLLAKGLGIEVTADGIENKEQLEYMRAAGVDLVQGYLLGRPAPALRFIFPITGTSPEMVA